MASRPRFFSSLVRRLARLARISGRSLVVLLAASVGQAAHAAVQTHSVSLPTVADTSLFQNNPDFNLGATTLVAGTNQQFSRSRALFRFDLSSIPAGAFIQEARVRMSVVRRPDPDQHGGPVNSEFSLFRLLVAWGEGSGELVTGSPAGLGDATWTYRQYSNDPWTFAGGGAGDDYASSASSATLVAGVGDYVFETTPILVSDVQSWLDHPETNHGFILISSNDYTPGTARRWASREQSGGGTAPVLDVVYATSDSPAGALDAAYDPSPDGAVLAAATQMDGRVVIGGGFLKVGTTSCAHLARLTPGGAVDATFPVSTDGPVECVAIQPDGAIAIGGGFGIACGVNRSRLARVGADGTIDPTFAPDPNDSVHAIAILPDRRLVIAGAFTQVAGTSRTRVARLNPDGTLDAVFAPVVDGEVNAVALQSDGRIILGGAFTSVNGVTRHHVARLYSDGSLDGAFNPDADAPVECIVLQADGKILIGGEFEVVDNAGRAHLARLHPDGTVDDLFGGDVAAGTSTSVRTIALQTDGRILIGGDFTMAGGFPRHGMALLNADSSLDQFFKPDPNGVVHCLSLQHDGQMLVGGDFTMLADAARSGFGRLQNDPAISTLAAPDSTRVQWLRGGSAPETQQVTFDLSSDGGQSWSPLGIGTRIDDGWELRGLVLPEAGQIRARAVVSESCFGGSTGVDGDLLARIALPRATTGPVTNLAASTVTLTGTVDANNAAAAPVFEYGLSSAYGATVAASPATVTGDSSVAVTATITGLSPRTVYHYRLKATNSAGSAVGDDATFTTGNSAPGATSASFTVAAGRITAIDLAALATDADGDPRTIFAGMATHGSVTVENGMVLYQPEPSYAGTDTVTYWVADGFGGVATGTLTLTIPSRPADPVPELVALKGDPIPGAGVNGSGTALLPTGARWFSFGIPAINQAGDFAFLATVDLLQGANLHGIFKGDPTAPQLVALKGAAAADVPGANFASFKDPVLSEAGAIAFIAGLANAPRQHEVTGATDAGIWSDAVAGVLALVARTGAQATDAPVGAVWSSFQSVALPEGAAGPLFVGRLKGGGVKPGNDVGLWGASSSGPLRLLLREGDLVGGKTVKNFVVLAAASASPGQARSFNRAGEIVVRATFTDGTSGVVKMTGP